MGVGGGVFCMAHGLGRPWWGRPWERQGVRPAPRRAGSWRTQPWPLADTSNFIPGLKGHVQQSDIRAGIFMGRSILCVGKCILAKSMPR